MSETLICSRCQHGFIVKDGAGKTSCPKCGRSDAVEETEATELMNEIGRQWLGVFALLFVVGLLYAVFELVKG